MRPQTPLVAAKTRMLTWLKQFEAAQDSATLPLDDLELLERRMQRFADEVVAASGDEIDDAPGFEALCLTIEDLQDRLRVRRAAALAADSDDDFDDPDTNPDDQQERADV